MILSHIIIWSNLLQVWCWWMKPVSPRRELTGHSSLHCFPGGSEGKASACNAGDPGFNTWVGKSPWRRKWQSTPTLLPGKSHGWRSLVGYSPWGRRVGHDWATSLTHPQFLAAGQSGGARVSKDGLLCFSALRKWRFWEQPKEVSLL